MLSSLPKVADRAFILGHLFPTILFALGALALFSDLPWAAAFLASLAQGENWQKLAFFVLVVWTLAVALQMLNVFIFRVLEGYTGPAAALSFLDKRQRANSSACAPKWTPCARATSKARWIS